MRYQVIPFVASIESGQGAEVAAEQLQQLISEEAAKGWRYVRLESVEIIIHDPGKPGTSGCFGIGAQPGVPPSQSVTRYDMAVFSRDD